MVDCQRIHDSLSDYIEGSLEGKRFQAVEAHLKRCPACMGLCERVRKTMLLLGSLPEIAPSLTFEQKLRERTRAERARAERRLWDRLPSFRFPRPRPAFTFSVVVLTVTLGLFLFRGSLFQGEQPLILTDAEDQTKIERFTPPPESTDAESPIRLAREGATAPNYVLSGLSPQILELRREYYPLLWEPFDKQTSIAGETNGQEPAQRQYTVRYVLPSAYPQTTAKTVTFNP